MSKGYAINLMVEEHIVFSSTTDNVYGIKIICTNLSQSSKKCSKFT